PAVAAARPRHLPLQCRAPPGGAMPPLFPRLACRSWPGPEDTRRCAIATTSLSVFTRVPDHVTVQVGDLGTEAARVTEDRPSDGRPSACERPEPRLSRRPGPAGPGRATRPAGGRTASAPGSALG